MQPAEKQIGSKAIRYLIGASILLLALMLFSELSCSLLGLCTNWFPLAEFIGFWEMLGITTALVFSSFSVRALRRNNHSPVLPLSDAPPHTTEDHYPLLKNQEKPQSPPREQPYSWRHLFNQLSTEEKQKLKSIMEEHCIPPAQEVADDKSKSA